MSISLAIVALGCGNAIESATDGWVMLEYTFLALAVFLVALILAAIGVSAENERMEQENRKIKRIPHHTNEWRDVR
jgi:hypothetical protein